MPVETHPDLLVGKETGDDAGVFRLTEELALIQTVDFFTPIVNDPFRFGQIAAANALSDVYAMGGRPLTAMNIVCFPIETLELDFLKEILKGGADKVHEANAVVVGGHSVEDPELKYGLAVAGLVHPEKILTNEGAKPGDVLLLTKPLGTGVIATAVKGRFASDDIAEAAEEIMAELNAAAARVMADFPVNGCTDVTGFGFLGHALEMARASRVGITIFAENVPLIPGVLDLAAMGLVPVGSFRNLDFCRKTLKVEEGVQQVVVDLLADAQTSGGLIISLPEDHAQGLLEGLWAEGILHSRIVGVVHAEGPGSINVV
jgi:selenide,water dikinase